MSGGTVRPFHFLCGDEESGHYACIDVHLTTAYNPGMRLMLLWDDYSTIVFSHTPFLTKAKPMKAFNASNELTITNIVITGRVVKCARHMAAGTFTAQI